MNNDHFVQKTHSYYMDGIEVPGNTFTLVDNGILDTEFCTPEGRVRGTNVHLLTQYFDEGDYSEAEAVRLGLQGYVESWKKARERWGFLVLEIERIAFHKLFRYGTTIDRLVLLDGWETIVEIKSGANEPGHRFQTAAQELACESALGPYTRGLRRRGAFYLHKDGTEATWRPHNDPADRNAFLAMLACTNLRIKLGISKLPGETK
jgi:hypothetical protein